MATQGQLTGMQGVFLVAAELSRQGFVVSPTSRSARGADLLVTDAECKKAFSVSVKTNAGRPNFWLLDSKASQTESASHIYAFVNLHRDKMDDLFVNMRTDKMEYFIVPSSVVAKNVKVFKSKTGSVWYSFPLKIAKEYEGKWDLFSR